MTKQCPKCWEIFDWEANSVTCPHKGFPRTVICEAHGRANCGNPECEKGLPAKLAVSRLALAGPKRKVG